MLCTLGTRGGGGGHFILSVCKVSLFKYLKYLFCQSFQIIINNNYNRTLTGLTAKLNN